MKLTTSAPFIKHFLLLLLLSRRVDTRADGPSPDIGKWTTLSYTMPINPSTSRFCITAKFWWLPARETARPASRDVHQELPTVPRTVPAPFWYIPQREHYPVQCFVGHVLQRHGRSARRARLHQRRNAGLRSLPRIVEVFHL